MRKYSVVLQKAILCLSEPIVIEAETAVWAEEIADGMWDDDDIAWVVEGEDYNGVADVVEVAAAA